MQPSPLLDASSQLSAQRAHSDWAISKGLAAKHVSCPVETPQETRKGYGVAGKGLEVLY